MSMVKPWHSSPTRENSSVDAIEERQRARAGRLYQPMSSPIKEATQTGQRHRLREQMRHMREDIRQQRQELSREKTVHDEYYNARLKSLQEQADALDTDLELLLEEEKNIRESTEAVSAPDGVDQKYLEELEDELEDFLAEEELELEAQLRDLQI
ncbi:hypothetical protein JCM33374_g352 [Metschnikowia sp. JCM 33374]|nr:hypothetical protein JCM33374_g352 [Metschnikowia sp. JCM 33374]